MRKQLNIFAVMLVLVFLISGCTKPDTTPPVITLSGNNPDTLILNQKYVEPGYTAQDNQDGDITNHVGISGFPALNRDIAGKYLRYYTVNDATGNNDTVVRTVTVYNQASILSGKYECSTNCQYTGGVNFNSTISPSNYVNYYVLFTNLGAFGDNIIDSASYNPINKTLAFGSGQSLGGNNRLVSAWGTVYGNAPHFTIFINYFWTDGVNTDNCTATYSN